jgi:hypothetical protein
VPWTRSATTSSSFGVAPCAGARALPWQKCREAGPSLRGHAQWMRATRTTATQRWNPDLDPVSAACPLRRARWANGRRTNGLGQAEEHHHATLAATEGGQRFVDFVERRGIILPVVGDPHVARRTDADVDRLRRAMALVEPHLSVDGV